MVHPVYLILILIVGLILGSFLNVLIYRLPRGRGVIRGRSVCPRCGQVLAWYDLVPVVSFFVLTGKCRQCHTGINWQYPLVEILSAAILVSSFLVFRADGPAVWIFTAFILEITLILFFTDIRHLILPDSVIIAGLAGGLIFSLLGLGRDSFLILSSANILAGAVFFLILFLIWRLSAGAWLGLGDAKYMALLGLIFGPAGSGFIFYAGLLIGGLVSLILLFLDEAGLKTKLPLGAFISLAVFVYVFWGASIIRATDLVLIFR